VVLVVFGELRAFILMLGLMLKMQALQSFEIQNVRSYQPVTQHLIPQDVSSKYRVLPQPCIIT
jgi:hypothetical protein